MKAWTSIARTVFGLLPLGVSASAMLYYARHEAPALPALDAPHAEFVTASGMLVPAREIKILATGESRVVRIDVEPGETVHRGQPLALIESDSQREAVPAPLGEMERELSDARAALQAKESRLRTEQAALAIVRAEFAISDDRWRNARELNEGGLIARLEFESEQREFETARAALDEALEVVRSVQISRDKASSAVVELESRAVRPADRKTADAAVESRVLRSPVDGIVGEILVRPGTAFAAPEEGVAPPIVMTVLDPSRLNARVLFSALESGTIFPESGVAVEVAGTAQGSVRGRVVFDSGASDGIRALLIEIDGWQADWRAGQICTVKLLTSPITGPLDEFVLTNGAMPLSD